MSVTDSQRSLKRDHDSFEETQFGLEEPYPVPAEFLAKLEAESKSETIQPTFSLPMPHASVPPARSNSGSVLSDLGPTTPSYASDSGSAPQMGNNTDAFAAMSGAAPPPAKKAKLTFAEKEMRRIQKEIRDQEKAAEKAKREADRQALAEEKARKDAEKEVERKKREVEREEKRVANEVEKAAKEERRKKKEEEKLKRDEEKAKAEEEKKKKARSQKTLGSFFMKPAGANAGGSGRTSVSPAPMASNPSLATASPAATPSKNKVQKSAYDKMFPEFFIHSDVKVARTNRFERDEEATETIEQMIDGYTLGDRSPGKQRAFDATDLFHLQGPDILRGKRCMPVREIMAEASGKASRPIDLTTDSQNSQIKKMGDMLKSIPMKFLHFREDVRPPYRGTYTSRPVNGIHRLARNPLRKDLPNTNYDYDSEAEWVEDEDAEDCNSDGEEEDADGEDGEDMEGFLDDENDESNISKRMVLQGDLEPVSSGLCWENERKKNTNVKMLAYRMEIIVGMSPSPFPTPWRGLRPLELDQEC